MSGAAESAGQTGILLTTRRFLINTLRKVRVELDDGPPVVRSWGTSFIATPPGRHTLRCWYPANFAFKAGVASLQVDIGDGEVVKVEYCAPVVGVNPGTWRVG